MKRIVLSVCAAVAAAVVAQAKTYTWNAGTTGNWEDAANWSVDGGDAMAAPGEGDDVLLPAPEGAADSYTVTATEAINVRNLTIGAVIGQEVGTVTFESKTKETHQVAGNLTVKDKGIMKHGEQPTTVKKTADILYRLDMAVGGDATIEDDGEINVSGCGYTKNVGPGVRCHGGIGVNASYHCYGSIRQPTDLGSGGSSGAGGGAVHLDVAGTLTLNGTINAQNKNTSDLAGEPAGGSVWLAVGKLEGGGSVLVNSVSSYKDPNGRNKPRYGGGGRISVVQTNAAELGFTGSLNADRGTLYLENTSDAPGRGELQLQGDNSRDGNVRELSAAVGGSTEPFGKISFMAASNGGTLKIVDVVVPVICDLRTAGYSITSGNTATQKGGIDFQVAAGRTLNVGGNIAVDELVCTNGNATLAVDAGTTLKINPNGSLVLKGEDADSLLTMSGSANWTINVGVSCVMDVRFVKPFYSNANGLSISDMGGVDGGNNQNWSFPRAPQFGDTLTWVGGRDTDFLNGANWRDVDDKARAPIGTDNLLLPSGCQDYPTLSSDYAALSMTLQAGAKMSVSAGCALSLHGDLLVAPSATFTLNGDASELDLAGSLTCSGRVVCCGSDALKVGGNVKFVQNSFVAAHSPLTLVGDAEQTFDAGGNAFYKIVVETAAATFLNGFKTYGFICTPETFATLRFSAGDVYEMTSARVEATEAKGVMLDSTVEAAAWYLKAEAGAIFRNVSVKDCNASKGATICTVSHENRGNTVNWRDGLRVWKGTTTTWETASNWEGGVPTNTSDVIILAAGKVPTLNGATTIRSLAIGDGTAEVTLTLRAELTVRENLNVCENAKVVIDKPLVVSNNLVVCENATLTHTKNSDKPTYAMHVIVGRDMNIVYGGLVTAWGCGYANGKGDGYTPSAYIGGIHGGYGVGVPTVKCYGSIRRPTTLGSGGSQGPGGGAIHLDVTGTLTLDGTIDARNGDDGQLASQGAGGSIWLKVGTLAGGGLATVTGYSTYKDPNGRNMKRPGGGGHLSVQQHDAVDQSCFTGTLEAQRGTLYVENKGDLPGRGVLILQEGTDDPVKIGAYIYELSDGVSDAEDPFGKIVFAQQTGKLKLSDGVVVKVAGDVEAVQANKVEAVASTSGGIDLCATNGTQHLAGTYHLGSFIATNGAAALEFAAGTSITNYSNGALWLEGQAGRKMRLASSVPGESWYLNAGTNLTGKVCNLDVSDSDAGGGQTIKAKRSVGRSKRANNRNWEFPAGFALIVK